jgi:uncharacterized protein (DUF924 family)
LITPLARVVANRALARGFDQATDEMMRPFFCLPLMHSELVADQDRCVRLHETFGDPELLKCATLHRDIVVKFGRFPHRIRAMGRDTTPAEQEFFGRWRVRGVVLCGFPRPQGAISAAIPRSLFQARSK